MLIDHASPISLSDRPPISPARARVIEAAAAHVTSPVPASVAAQARRQPDAVALAMGSETVTFAEFDSRASQLANYLRSLGVGPETVVGLCVERSPRFVIAALAIMKTGAAYLPLDSAHPAERLRFILKDAVAALLVTTAGAFERFIDAGLRVVSLDAEKAAIDGQPTAAPDIEPSPDQLAYVIYTSGSTGEPKGVEITHGNLTNLVSWHIGAFAVTASDRATFQAGVGFDAAVWEIWPYLAVGATVWVPDEETRLSAEALRDWLVAQEITVSFVPTALAEQLIALPWPAECALRFLLTGADTLHRCPPPGLPFALVNNYGPTECAVVATSGVIAPTGNPDGLPSIGRPIDNVQVHIVDEQLRAAPHGVAGEICIGGAGVARGYRNRPDLSTERFVADPFRADGSRWYRTGDLGRFLPNGEIAFLGRMDDQVKIRGYRIELGEINAVLNEQPSVQASFVIAREDQPGDKRLVAYVVPTAGSAQDEKGLRESLGRRLPDYMEPAAFVWLDALPLTPNGKVDRAALPPPSVGDTESNAKFIAPRTPVEKALAAIMADVLGIPRISADDDFFHLGAHSLLGAQVIARVRSAFGVELRLLDVFDAPTVAELSVKIEEALTNQLAAMSDDEVEAALAAMNSNGAGSRVQTLSH